MRTYFYKNFKDTKTSQMFRRYLVKKAMRSQSGVLVVTITLSPNKFSCKYDCYYCPQETDLQGNHTQPRSYMSSEPAMRRANRHNFDVRGQFWDRIECYISTGNININDKSSKKMEVILSGGTWECYPKEERDRFIHECYWAANTYGLEDREMLSLEEEIKINETADYRIIGMTLETRPDFINKTAIRDYRRYGVTRIQIGVQHYDDEILRKVNRKCYTKHTIKAIRLLKQTGLKVVVHLMPDLPGSSPELDKWMFDMAINNPELQFDDVKIYPTAVCRSHSDQYILTSKIAEWYDEGSFRPYAEDDINKLIQVIKYYLININPWVRVQRCIRDIPGCSIEAGYQKKSNLRQMIQQEIDSNNEQTFEIRNMEVRESKYLNYPARLVVRKYEASGGMEYHLSMEAYEDDNFSKIKYYLYCIYANLMYMFSFDEKKYWSGSKNYVALFGFLRLRLDNNPGGDIIPEINNSALIREVHVYGNSLGVGSDNLSSQHRGYGQYLMNVAEQIAIDNDWGKTSVISGVGTREYYKNKCGYHLEGTYMIKKLNDNRPTKVMINFSILVLAVSSLYFLF
tara:strand:- start:490 stop:2199 length:1710 start_codon:yes stop_codon:yes gene_type:complete